MVSKYEKLDPVSQEMLTSLLGHGLNQYELLNEGGSHSHR